MDRTLTVKQINNYIGGVFDDELILHNVNVSGEVFDFKISQNNTFIVLKEDDNVLECYKYGKLEHIQKGTKVTILGRIKFYPKSGKVWLNISSVKLSGEGQYHIEFQKLKQSLKQKGYFDNKTPLPVFIKRVAIVTSIEGAVLHDFMSVINDGHDYIDVEVFNVSVQGEGASGQIVSAIAQINQAKNADVIVIARGGGSYQDLLPFNTEQIASAVFNSKIPIISAVGHQTDYTLCDFCSALRAPTPSLAGESVVKINQNCFDKMQRLLLRGLQLLNARVQRQVNYVSVLSQRISQKNQLAINQMENMLISKLRDIGTALDRKIEKLKNIVCSKTALLNLEISNLYDKKNGQFSSLSVKLDSISPLKLMAGGYAKVISDDGVITSIKQVSTGKTLKVTLFDGTFKAKVESINKMES